MAIHDPATCGKCAACLFEKSIREWESKKKYRVLDTKISGTGTAHGSIPTIVDRVHRIQVIEDQINAFDKEGYEMVAVDHGIAFFRAIPPQLPPGIQIVKASDLKKAEAEGESGGFSDEDIGKDFK